MKRPVSRRGFLGRLLAAACAVPFGCGRFRDPREELRAHFHYLEIDDAAIDAYVSDYERVLGRRRMRDDPEDFHTRFLLSADFFPGADESRPVSYVALYEPYTTPCLNPLAEL